MININLISIEDKKEIVQLRAYFIIKHLAYNIISLLLIISTVFVFTNLLITNTSESLDQQIQTEKEIASEKKLLSIEEATVQLNNQLIRAEKLQVEYVKWTTITKQLFSLIPDGIKINTLTLNTELKKAKITGISQTRDKLLNFQEKMSDFSYFENVTFPISNLVEKENVSFEVNADISNKIYE